MCVFVFIYVIAQVIAAGFHMFFEGEKLHALGSHIAEYVDPSKEHSLLSNSF